MSTPPTSQPDAALAAPAPLRQEPPPTDAPPGPSKEAEAPQSLPTVSPPTTSDVAPRTSTPKAPPPTSDTSLSTTPGNTTQHATPTMPGDFPNGTQNPTPVGDEGATPASPSADGASTGRGKRPRKERASFVNEKSTRTDAQDFAPSLQIADPMHGGQDLKRVAAKLKKNNQTREIEEVAASSAPRGVSRPRNSAGQPRRRRGSTPAHRARPYLPLRASSQPPLQLVSQLGQTPEQLQVAAQPIAQQYQQLAQAVHPQQFHQSGQHQPQPAPPQFQQLAQQQHQPVPQQFQQLAQQQQQPVPQQFQQFAQHQPQAMPQQFQQPAPQQFQQPAPQQFQQPAPQQFQQPAPQQFQQPALQQFQQHQPQQYQQHELQHFQQPAHAHAASYPYPQQQSAYDPQPNPQPELSQFGPTQFIPTQSAPSAPLGGCGLSGNSRRTLQRIEEETDAVMAEGSGSEMEDDDSSEAEGLSRDEYDEYDECDEFDEESVDDNGVSGSESGFDLDEDLDAMIDQVLQEDDHDPDAPAKGTSPRTHERPSSRKRSARSNGTKGDALSYHLLDQFNAIMAENRAHNNAMMKVLHQLDKRMEYLEQGTAGTSFTPVAKRDTEGIRAPKPARSKLARVELPAREDGKPHAGKDIPALTAVELEYLNRLARVVRLHFKKLLRVKSYSDMADKCTPLTPEAIAAYNKSPIEKDYFNPKNFRVDFSRAWATFPFNVEARDYFIRHLLHAIRGGSYQQPKYVFPQRYLTEYHIGSSLDSHVEHCRATIRRINNPPSESDIAEDERNARARQRRGTLLKQRNSTVEERGYTQHALLMSKLRAKHMSDDETDVEEPRKRSRENRFRIIDNSWMSVEMRGLLRSFDADYLEDWETSPDRRSAGGSPPRLRVIANPPLSTLGHVPKGLWRNCYSDAYINKLKPHEYRRLNVIEKPYNFKTRTQGNGKKPEFVQGSSRG